MEQQKVLIVDDSPANIQILSQLLTREYEVLVAVCGRDALELVDLTVPDLILLDIMMPEMDGYTVCSMLKAKPHLKEIPIIFITALSKAENECFGLELGAVDFVSKPFNPAVIKLRVKNQLELKRYRDLYHRISLLDGLTGIANRRCFDENLEREWFRAMRSRTRLSLIMMDVDFFKSYNDAHGHIAGDDCLKAVAGAIAAPLGRAADFAARYGGEEFACILPDTGVDGALEVAERIRVTVEALQIPHGDSGVSPFVTVSLGCSTVVPELSLAQDMLIEAADRALYRAKSAGRNRCEKAVTRVPGG